MYPRLRELRKNKGVTQAKIGKIIGLSQTGYSKYESGENDIPTSILIHLASYYNTNVDYILGITDIKEPYPPSKEGK